MSGLQGKENDSPLLPKAFLPRKRYYTLSYYNYSPDPEFQYVHGNQLDANSMDKEEETFCSPPPVKRVPMPEGGLPPGLYNKIMLNFFHTENLYLITCWLNYGKVFKSQKLGKNTIF